MTNNSTTNKIRELIETWAYNTRMGLQDKVLTNHSPNVIIYDVLPPMKYEGADAYRASWDEWQPKTTGAIIFELRDLEITAGDDVAFAHAFIQCGGTTTDGKSFEDLVRATFCLQKKEGKWLVMHQHSSIPRQ